MNTTTKSALDYFFAVLGGGVVAAFLWIPLSDFITPSYLEPTPQVEVVSDHFNPNATLDVTQVVMR